ncbi:unnamed protein product [Adineta steineri]|uniref:Uncharacterized protein n=1 Tax=Adineta steineri TaxID=433720 RepID=A0A813WLB0_9BILA|nr:unnamed protein product [Adineta steineri]CAF3877562.1 unnamed protein product [Adineta steineri]
MAFINRKTTKNILKLITTQVIIITVVICYIVFYYEKPLNISVSEYNKTLNLSKNHNLSIKWNNHPRGVIVTLIGSTNTSVVRVINMIHSVIQFHSVQENFHYPFLIFHDQGLTLSKRQYILSCTNYTNKKINILFILLDYQTNAQISPNSTQRPSIGYRLMCRFWSYDVFYHPAIRNQQYDYLMRMDDDSYFLDKTKFDLFEYIHQQKLDYVYRSLYTDTCQALFSIEKKFTNRTVARTDCIYNNFFLIRLSWFYQSERIQRFLNELIRDDLMIREYIGDGCVHAAMIDIEKNIRIRKLVRIPYGHNYHIMLRNREGIYNHVNEFFSQMGMSCHQLTIIDSYKKNFKKIQISLQK